jgi:hypothetical protein
MAKQSHRQSHRQRGTTRRIRRSSNTRRKRGGTNASVARAWVDSVKRGGSNQYTSAATYGEYVNGTVGSQWARTMDQSGPYGQIQGNVIIGAQGQNVTSPSQIPTAANLELVQSAGRRRQRRGGYWDGTDDPYNGGKVRQRRGGFIGEVVNQAIVPFSLLGMQQSYRRKRGGEKRTAKRRERR